MRFTVNVYAARGHAIGNGGDGANRGSDLGTQINKSERDRYDEKRSEAVDEILRKLKMDRFISVPILKPDELPDEFRRREAA